ncbi:MAG: hypothetical protein VKJ64_04195 [Leptolyngbyaceae bacterium]|nr:hypothetical protein [Leptolyngbyaceae bacterium]
MTQRHGAIEWLDTIVRAMLRTALICLALYGLYLIKSIAGINLAPHYHGLEVFSQPVDVLVDIWRSHHP